MNTSIDKSNQLSNVNSDEQGDFVNIENISSQDLNNLFSNSKLIDDDSEEKLRRSTRTKHLPFKLKDFIMGDSKSKNKQQQQNFVDSAIEGEELSDEEFNVEYALNSYNNIADPQNLNEALKSENSENWIKAMENEYDKIVRNGTWELVKRPQGVNKML